MADAKGTIRSKDFISGLFFFSFGAFFFVIGRTYNIGTARAMGPGYFPAVLSILLVLVGIALIARSCFHSGAKTEQPAFIKMGLVVASVVVFGISLSSLGLPIAVILSTLLSVKAGEKFTWKNALILAVLLAAGSSIVFVVLLGLPIPLLGTWLGGR
ncbi:MAG: tripartite tricarboxylate transporter TctB family protein [Treponemataceae bacterium]